MKSVDGIAELWITWGGVPDITMGNCRWGWYRMKPDRDQTQLKISLYG